MSDGTLAGADLDLTTALRVLTSQCGVSLDESLEAATSIPAALIDAPVDLRLPGQMLTDMIRIKSDLSAASPVIG